MNSNIINQFNKLIKHIKYSSDNSTSNKFRLQQTIKILDILKKYNKEITSGEQLASIKGIGQGTVDRINEILKTGYLSEITNMNTKAYEELESIFGIGKSLAKTLIEDHKITSIKQLKDAIKNNKITVSSHVLLGLKYNNAIKQMIPREELDEINKYLHKLLHNITFEICGSYRRGKNSSSDIDILLTGKTNNLRQVVDILKKSKFIIEDIDINYEVKYMGFAKLTNIRRLDIMYVPIESYPYALLHYTGSGSFNQRMREVAKELGYMLNQYGLYVLDKNGNKIRNISAKDEKDIFDQLGMEYLEPKLRE